MIEIGDNIYLSGGYDYEIKWLNGNDGYNAKMIDFIPGQNDETAMLIQFESEIITADNKKGQYTVLELRYQGAKWNNKEVVHIELCDFYPEKKTKNERKTGEWIESHATITKL